MKNDILNINNFCDSCRHLMEEQGEDTSLFSREKLDENKLNYCYRCGQPILSEINPFEKDLDLLESALLNPKLKVVCYTAPSVRVALGDEFGMPAGAFVQGKMVTALKSLGFDAVFDMNTAADFTIIEEAHELVERLNGHGVLPMFTSCCPGWVNYATKLLPKYVPNLSTTKSPQQIFGALLNTYYAQKAGIDPKSLFVVSVVPCVSKKLELRQSHNVSEGYDVDVAITTRELAQFLKHKGIDLKVLEDSPFDEFFGSSSGAGAIFGNTGGVMEAVLRTLGYELKDENARLDYEMVRGLDNIRRATITLGERKLNLAVVTGLKNLPTIIEELEAQPQKYDFVEVMACDGGCIGGAGQPQVSQEKRDRFLKARAKGLYGGDKKLFARRAHENPMVKKVYAEFLGAAGGEKAQKLLHRNYD